jgi:prophage DNA circulation protein
MTECLDTTTENLKTRLEVIEEVTTDNIANMTTAVNNQLQTIQENMNSINKRNENLQAQVSKLMEKEKQPHPDQDKIRLLEAKLTKMEV